MFIEQEPRMTRSRSAGVGTRDKQTSSRIGSFVVSSDCVPNGLFKVDAAEDFDVYPGGPVARVRRVHHDLFGLLLAPETPSDFSTLVGWVAQAWGNVGWRGQASLCWTIDSSLTRRVKMGRGWVLGSGEPLDRVVREAEARLLGRARLAGHDEHGSRRLSDLEMSAVLQHQGAATRLLDWTFNAYIALWFACRGRAHQDDWGLLMGLDAASAKVIRNAEERDRPMSELLADLDAEKTFGLWRPAALSPRIPAQQGFFVFSAVVDEVWGSVRFKGDELHETGRRAGPDPVRDKSGTQETHD